MNDGRGERGLTRRRVLYALGAAGTAGAVGGGRTAAYFQDDERYSATLTAGSLDLALECQSDGCRVDGDSVRVVLPDLLPGQTGSEQISLSLSGNPGWLWVSGSCPETGLADALDVTVTYDRGCDGATGTFVDTVDKSRTGQLTGTLREVLLELRAVLRLGTECLLPGERVCVTFDWEFPNESGVEAHEGTAIDFELGFHTRQCRHDDGSVPPVSPEPCPEGRTTTDTHGISYIEVWGCAGPAPSSSETECDCTKLGTVELSTASVEGCPELQTAGITENHIEPGVYDLSAGDCEPSGYQIEVTETDSTDGETTAVAFELLAGNGGTGPQLCRVLIKGSRETTTYEAEDLAPASNSTEGLLGAPEKRGPKRGRKR